MRRVSRIYSLYPAFDNLLQLGGVQNADEVFCLPTTATLQDFSDRGSGAASFRAQCQSTRSSKPKLSSLSHSSPGKFLKPESCTNSSNSVIIEVARRTRLVEVNTLVIYSCYQHTDSRRTSTRPLHRYLDLSAIGSPTD